MTNSKTKFIFSDGGRAEAGYKGEKAGDCVTRAIAIATGKPYQEVFDALNEIAKSERTGKRKKSVSNSNTGVYRVTMQKYLLSLGAKWTPTMSIGKGCKVHLRADELPKGRLVVNVSKHSVAMIDGVIYDKYDPSRGGKRCVYGYYTIPEPSGKQNKAITSDKKIAVEHTPVKTDKKPSKGKVYSNIDIEKLIALEEKAKRWESKRRRAENALKKLAKKIKYYKNKIGK